MRYAKIKPNDVANAPGISVSFYTQGCPHHCKGCFNEETWNFNGGKEFTKETLDFVISSLTKYDIKRSLCILGGEPLCKENIPLTKILISETRAKVPNTKIYIWTGYLYEELLKQDNEDLKYILNNSDFLIDGPFIQELKDLSLTMRGSSNQRVIDLIKKI